MPIAVAFDEMPTIRPILDYLRAFVLALRMVMGA